MQTPIKKSDAECMVCTSSVNLAVLYSTHWSISSKEGSKPEEYTITGTEDLWP